MDSTMASIRTSGHKKALFLPMGCSAIILL